METYPAPARWRQGAHSLFQIGHQVGDVRFARFRTTDHFSTEGRHQQARRIIIEFRRALSVCNRLQNPFLFGN